MCHSVMLKFVTRSSNTSQNLELEINENSMGRGTGRQWQGCNAVAGVEGLIGFGALVYVNSIFSFV